MLGVGLGGVDIEAVVEREMRDFVEHARPLLRALEATYVGHDLEDTRKI